MKLPDGFLQRHDTVECWRCRRAWRIPPPMTELSERATALLNDHSALHLSGVNSTRGTGKVRQWIPIPYSWRHR